MADRGQRAGRPSRAPMPARTRRRWAIAGCVAGLWVLLLAVTQSVVGGTAVLLLAAALGIGTCFALRWLGIDRHHPWVQRASTRPWRDGRDGFKQPRRDDPGYRAEDAAAAFMAATRAVRGHHDRPAAKTLVRDVLTVEAPSPVPPLRLVTNGAVAQTRVSGA